MMLSRRHKYKYIHKNSFVGDPIIQKHRTPATCGMATSGSCGNQIAAWTVGSNGECFEGDYGFRIGAGSYKNVMLEVNLALKTSINY